MMHAVAQVQANHDETDARLREIEDNLRRAAMPILERDEQVAEWVRLIEAKESVSRQNVAKSKAGRPEGAIAKAVRDLPIPGKTQWAQRKYIERAIDVDSITTEAKAAARTAGLDKIRSALLTIAKAPEDAQLATVQELVAARGARVRGAPKLPRAFHAGIRVPKDVPRDQLTALGEALTQLADLDGVELVRQDAPPIVRTKQRDAKNRGPADETLVDTG